MFSVVGSELPGNNKRQEKTLKKKIILILFIFYKKMRDAFGWKINNIFCSLTLWFVFREVGRANHLHEAGLPYFHFAPWAGSRGGKPSLVPIRTGNVLGCGALWAWGGGGRRVWWPGGRWVWRGLILALTSGSALGCQLLCWPLMSTAVNYIAMNRFPLPLCFQSHR